MRLPGYRWQEGLRGLCIYAGGDGIAALILGEFALLRLLGMMLIGGLVYAWEIPNWFAWIDRVTAGRTSGSLWRTAMAMLYFNPLWIARHLLFVQLASGRGDQIGWHLLATGLASFLGAIPITVAGNFAIQDLLPLRRRFLGSALFSAAMAVYYAACLRWFS